MGIWDEFIDANQVQITQKDEEKKVVCIKIGAICPHCASAKLSYDGKLNLVCPACGYEIIAGFT